MRSTRLALTASSLLASLLLSACGGGGGDDGAEPPSNGPIGATTSFPLQAAYRDWIAQGSSTRYTISGDCGGTAVITESSPIPVRFEEADALATVFSTDLQFTDCPVVSGQSTQTAYYSTGYAPIGGQVEGGGYTVATTTPVLPSQVRVGDAQPLSTQIQYLRGDKIIQLGTIELSYSIEADSPRSVIVNWMATTYDESRQLIGTTQTRYRLSAEGRLSPVSVDLTSGNLHVQLTPT